MKLKFKKVRLSPSLQILLGFLGIILVGTFLLCLPMSNSNGQWLDFVDGLFTSTSAVCVTGLTVVDTATTFTLFGEIVILLLIQIGGLGIIAVTSLIFILLRKKINLHNRMAIQESIGKETIQGVVKTIKKIIYISLIIEFVGVLLLLYSTITYSGSFWRGLYYAIFMSVSSFCNAGFDVFGESGKEFLSLNAFAGDVTMLLPIMMLVVIGGVGFIVLFDLFSKEKKKQHTKVVLIMTAILLFGGGIIFTILEWNNPNTLGNMPWYNKILNGFFQSVTTRTAGASTIDQSLLTTGSRVVAMMLMFIGGAPNSTAGGFKVTTLFVVLLFMFRLPNDNGDIRLRDRKISRKIIMKAFRIVMYTAFILIIAIVLMRSFESGLIPFESIIFECVSAISTVGLSMGITPLLTVGSKLVLTSLMFIGRVGIITIVSAISSRSSSQASQEIEFTNTDIMIG